MADQTIDRLNIEISADASSAEQSLSKLATSLSALSSALSSINTGKLSELATGLGALKANAKGFTSKSFTTISNSLTTLSAGIQAINGASVGDVGSQLTELAAGLQAFGESGTTFQNVDIKAFSTLGKALMNLGAGVQSINGQDMANISAQMAELVSQLETSFQAMSGLLQDGDMQQFATFANTIQSFGAGISQFSNGISKVQGLKIDGLGEKIKEIAEAIKPLTDEMLRGGPVALEYGQALKAIAEATKAYNAAEKQNGKKGNLYSLASEWFKFDKIKSALSIFQKFANVVKASVGRINSYIEDINLFSVAMGDAAESASELAYKMQDLLGVDAGEAMKYEGVFMQITKSFGTTAAQAEILSTNLTQLGYDLASFFNLKTEDAMEKLQSGITGQVRALRSIGIDISNARLQQELYALGIQKSVSQLNQADKALLRYIAIMKQTTNAQGDMGATLNTPANALRILHAQLEITSRWLGAVFIPILTKAISYIVGFVKALGMIFKEIADFMGFEMPEIKMPDSSSLTAWGDGLDDIADAAGRANKNLDHLIGGFDELHIINEKNSSGSDTEMGSILGGIDLPTYDMFERYAGNDFNEKAESLYKILKEILPVVTTIGTALAGWKIGSTLIKSIGGITAKLKDASKEAVAFRNALKLAAGITLMVGGFTLEFMGGLAIGRGDATLKDYIKLAIGSALGIAGSLIIFGTGPLGWTIGIAAAITIAIASISIGAKQRLDNMVKDAVFTETGGKTTISDYALEFQNVVTNITYDESAFIETSGSLETMKNGIADTTREIQLLQKQWGLGLIDTESATTKMAELITKLRDDSSSVLDQLRLNILSALSTSWLQALEDAGYSAGQIDEMLNNTLGEVSAQMQELYQQYSDGTITLGEYMRGMAELNGTTDLVSDSLRELNGVLSGIDFASEDSLNQGIADFITILSEAKDTVDLFGINLNGTLEQLNSYNVDDWSGLFPTVDAAQAAELQKIVTEAQTFVDGIERELVTRASQVAKAASEEWNNMDWFARLFSGAGSEEEYVSRALSNYNNNFVVPTENRMEEALGKMGIELTPKAEKILTGIIADTYSYGNEEQGYIGDYHKEISDETQKDFEELGINANAWAHAAGYEAVGALKTGISDRTDTISGSVRSSGKFVGENLSDGVGDGLEDRKTSLFTRIGLWGDSIVNKLKQKLGIHSPSTVMRDEIGVNLGLGIAEGIEASGSKVVDSLSGVIRDAIGEANKEFDGIEYDPDVDYQALINGYEGIATASEMAALEMKRNAKIAGEGLTQYEKTYNWIKDGLELDLGLEDKKPNIKYTGGVSYNRDMRSQDDTLSRLIQNGEQLASQMADAFTSAMLNMQATGGFEQDITLNITAELDGDVIYRNQKIVAARRGENNNLGTYTRV